MKSRRSLGLCLLVLLSVSTACTTGRMVSLQTQPGATAPPGLKSGDRVRVHLHDGSRRDFDFDHVSADGDVFGRQQEHVRVSDIALVERRSINTVRTSILIGSCVFVVVAAVFMIAVDDLAEGLDSP